MTAHDGGREAATIFEADLTCIDGTPTAGVQVEVLAGGVIGRVGALGVQPDVRLTNRMLLPGFINAHSHAFQRGLRGRGEDRIDGQDSFWTWREAMYGLVGSMDEASFARWTTAAYREMLACGITTVGEFHYVRHLGDGTDFCFDDVLIRCAREVGIRLVLLPVCYMTGGIGAPLQGAQLRFRSESAEQYLRRFDELERTISGPAVHLGMAAHSIRGVSVTDLVALHRAARARSRVFHLHLEEQRQEIQASLAHYGKTPMRLVLDLLEVGPHTTAVHCTHTLPAELEAYSRAGGIICLCPLTEANLADGISSLPAAIEVGGRFALGTDSNARISMLEEMRWLEYAQRLNTERRGVVVDERGRLAARRLAAATEGGATSLGIDAGAIRPGALADFVTVRTDAPALEGCDPAHLLTAMVLGGGDDLIDGVWGGGKRRGECRGKWEG